MKIFGNFDRNRIVFRKYQHRNFRKFDQNWNFSKILPKLKFFENFTKIEIFRKLDRPKSKFYENFDQNRNFSKFWPKSKFFELFEKSNLFGILNKLEIFRKLTEIGIFKNFGNNEIFVNFDQNRNCSKILTKSKIFENLTKF